jgi:hypothetical protein
MSLSRYTSYPVVREREVLINGGYHLEAVFYVLRNNRSLPLTVHRIVTTGRSARSRRFLTHPGHRIGNKLLAPCFYYVSIIFI